jgi:glycosyltransferase involved in cell wall biosynthesis
MRILMLAQFYAPIVGGEERMTESLAGALVERGHEVAVATLRQPGLIPFEERGGIRVHRLGGLAQRVGSLFSDEGRRHAPPAPDPETVMELRRVIVAERPDVVHGHNWLAHAYLPLRRNDPAAYVLSLHDYSLLCSTKRLMRNGEPCSGPGLAKCVICASGHYGPVIGPPVALLTALSGRAQQRAADLLLPVSNEVARRCGLAKRGLPYTVVPNFRAQSGPTPEPDPALAALLPSEPFILFAGDITTDKGVGILLEAHSRMSNRVPLVLAGRPVEAHLIPVRDDVINLGLLPHDDVLAAWGRCAVGVVPSIWPDSFPTVALEAMAAGAAVVVSRIGGLPEAVTDSESGLLVEPGDAGQLAAALDRLMGDAPLRERLGAGARTRVEAFSAPAVVPRYEAAYAQALAVRSATLAGAREILP